MPIFEFTIPFNPVAKGRPRFNSVTKRTYTPKKTVDAENAIALIAKSLFRKTGHKTIKGAIALEVTFCIAMPSSWSKKKRSEMNGLAHIGKPDIDNLIKSFDALNDTGIWGDDSQVCEVYARKVWGTTGFSEVSLRWDDE